MQTQTAMRYDLITFRRAIIKTQEIVSIGKYVGKGNLFILEVRM